MYSVDFHLSIRKYLLNVHAVYAVVEDGKALLKAVWSEVFLEGTC